MAIADRLFSWIYNLALALLALVALPKLLYQRVVHKKYRDSFWPRWGIGLPPLERGDRPLVWIHAVSMGETKAVVTLAKMMKEKIPDAQFIISNVTETGHAEAKKSLKMADLHLYMPFDFSFVVRRVIRRYRPSMVVLTEGDLWLNFLSEAKRSGASVVLVNGKLSEKSMRRYQWLPAFSRRLFGTLDRLCVQNEIYRSRFVKVGVLDDKIVITGNLKFDAEYPVLPKQELVSWKARLGIKEEDQVLVIGSSHDPEEKQLLAVLKPLWNKLPALKVLLVPRHPERFDEVATLLEKEQVPFVRWSSLDTRKGGERVILVDAMGVLRSCYQLADVALVAGSYTERVGGHNILEPCGYGVPVLFGPCMHSQPELVELVQSYKAGLSVNIEALESKLGSLWARPAERQQLGEAGRRLISELRGSTLKTWTNISQAGVAKRASL